MFLNKKHLQLFAEKPERFSTLCDDVLDSPRVEELRKIPNLAIGEISLNQTIESLCNCLSVMRPDAFLPTISYTGTEHGSWSRVEGFLKILKAAVQQELHIYCPDAIILGAPKFWWALNGRFAFELFNHFGFMTYCYGCRLYSIALRIPLCKMLDARVLIPYDHVEGDFGCGLSQYAEAIKYYKIFMLNFGIDLCYENKYKEYFESDDCKNHKVIYCALCGNTGSLKMNDNTNDGGLKKYFESYALPFTAKIISRTLSGVPSNYLDDALEFLPNNKNFRK